jgi:hypothetical protein
MSYGTFWLRALLGMVGLPQALGFALSRLSPNRDSRRWLWPVVSALTFSCGWILMWSIEAPRPADPGQYACGQWLVVAGAGLLIFGPANLIIAGVLQVLFSFRSRRKGTPG